MNPYPLSIRMHNQIYLYIGQHWFIHCKVRAKGKQLLCFYLGVILGAAQFFQTKLANQSNYFLKPKALGEPLN